MARKHLLDHLLTPAEPAEAPPALPQRKPSNRGVGVVGAMSESFEAMATNLREAQEKLATGDLVVEVPTELIDPSFITDRIGDDDDMEAFTASIREHGQRTPILLRPHPELEGRYQIAYGHRRYRALKSLGLPVKAQIKSLTDDELVVAQGQENHERLDLSYIERAVFAARLEGKNFNRETISSALGIDKTELSRMITVGTTIPGELIEAIGPAQATGRRKWLELAKSLEKLDWVVERDRFLPLCRESGVGSDDRFKLVLRHLLATPNSKTEDASGKEQSWSFKIEKKPGLIRIVFDEANLPKDAVDDCVSRIRDVCNSFGVKT
jgi:ParB family chromosome partitioning protein